MPTRKNIPKAEYLGLMSVCFWLGFRISISSYGVCENRALVSFLVWVFCFRSRFIS
ncbi:hypothetical protein VDIAB_280003 [Vibrio diabolicus]|nr:hypothetical protein VDIAB_280003 [Vibrio diabolicus]